MSHDAASDLSSSSVSIPLADPIAQMPLTVAMVVGIVGLFLFLSSQIVVIAGGLVWAVGSYLHLALAGFSVLAAIVGAPAVWLCWKTLRLAIQAERDPVNN